MYHEAVRLVWSDSGYANCARWHVAYSDAASEVPASVCICLRVACVPPWSRPRPLSSLLDQWTVPHGAIEQSVNGTTYSSSRCVEQYKRMTKLRYTLVERVTLHPTDEDTRFMHRVVRRSARRHMSHHVG